MSGARDLLFRRPRRHPDRGAPDEQLDSLEKIRLMPGVIPALIELRGAGFDLVMVTNQDGLGSASFRARASTRAHRFILELFASQGIALRASIHLSACQARGLRLPQARDRHGPGITCATADRPCAQLPWWATATPTSSSRQSRRQRLQDPSTVREARLAGDRRHSAPAAARRSASDPRDRRRGRVDLDLAPSARRIAHGHRLLRPHAGADRESTAASRSS